MAGNLTAMIASIFSGGATADPFFNRTTLLLPGTGTNGAQNNTFLDSSSNTFTVTRNGNTTQGTFSPFSQTGWSNYFDGSGDFINTPATGQFAPAGDFTIRFWFYLTSLAATNHLIGNYSAAATTDWLLEVTTGGVLQVFTNGSTLRLSQSGITANQWYYVTVTRTGTTITGQLNGTNFNTTATYTQSGTFGTATKSIYLGMRTGSTNPLTGYLSNVSLVDGSAIQTVPTAPLTDVTGTKLLTCQSNRFVDNSSSPNTLTIGGNTSVVPFSPFNPTSAWSASTVGGSGYFDGSGDYLSVPANAAFQLGTGDFSIEAWIYPTTTPGGQYPVVIRLESGGYNSNGLTIFWRRFNVNPTGISVDCGGVISLAGTSTVALNTWTHVAVTRTGTTFALFVNGTREATTTSSNNFSVNDSVYIGDSTSDTEFPGYISNVRIVKGSNVYGVGTTLTVPTAPLTAITNTSLLLNFTNAGIYDATSKNDLETVGNAQISTTQSKWGGSSIYVDGTGDRLFNGISSPLLNLSSGDWTIESWVYFNAVGAYAYVLNIATAPANPSGLVFGINNSSRIYIGNGAVLGTNGNTTLSTGQWYYLAAVKSGANVTLYVNGSADVTPFAFTPNSGTYLYVGSDASAGNQLNAYLQDVRITRYARTITASPTAAFPLQ